MNELEPFIQMILVFVVTTVPIAAVVRILAGPDGDAQDVGPGRSWPRGVQEEEPLPWKLGAAAG